MPEVRERERLKHCKNHSWMWKHFTFCDRGSLVIWVWGRVLTTTWLSQIKVNMNISRVISPGLWENIKSTQNLAKQTFSFPKEKYLLYKIALHCIAISNWIVDRLGSEARAREDPPPRLKLVNNSATLVNSMGLQLPWANHNYTRGCRPRLRLSFQNFLWQTISKLPLTGCWGALTFTSAVGFWGIWQPTCFLPWNLPFSSSFQRSTLLMVGTNPCILNPFLGCCR